MSNYITPFTPSQLQRATTEVEQLARSLQGRKLEEDDWTALYCRVKNLTPPGWSNLPFRDFLHNGIGVEFKLLKRGNPIGDIGRSLMHPAATRTINFSEDDDPNDAMEKVLAQWSSQIADFETRIAETSPNGTADARWGVLLWAPDHTQFLYFEEPLIHPNPREYFAEWSNGRHRGKTSTNLHIYDRTTGRKAYSCTVPRNGAKLQPYFRVPSESEGAAIFQPAQKDVIPLFGYRDDIETLRRHFPGTSDEDILRSLLNTYLSSD